MNKITINKNFRIPDFNEKKTLSLFIENQNRMNTKSQKKIAIGLMVIAFVLVVSGALSTQTSGGIMVVVLGLGCFIGAISCIKGYKSYDNFAQTVKSGDFLICEGIITKVASRDSNGRISIGFASKDDTFKSEWYKVRIENIQVGKEVYLIAVSSKKTEKYDAIAVTPFMLSEEGCNLFC